MVELLRYVLASKRSTAQELRAHVHICASEPGREDRMQPMGSPLPAKPAGTVTMGPPSAVHGEMYLGSPVQPSPSGAVPGAAGHRKTSAVSAAEQRRPHAVDLAALVEVLAVGEWPSPSRMMRQQLLANDACGLVEQVLKGAPGLVGHGAALDHEQPLEAKWASLTRSTA